MLGFVLLGIALVIFLWIACLGMADLFGFQLPPGPGTPTLTAERMAVLGPITWYLLKGGQINGATATDASNTPTTNLRHGLLMGQRTADGLLTNYQPNGTETSVGPPAVYSADGSQVVQGFLWESRDTIDTDGLTVNPTCQIVIAGYVRASQLLLLDEQARRQMQGRFIFDDRIAGPVGGPLQTISNQAAYTVVAGQDNETLFTTQNATGAVQFTLPAVAGAKGNRFRFYAEAAQTMEISAPAGTLVAGNNLAATNITFSTAGAIEGAWVEIWANADGTKWLSRYGGGTATIS